jgi:protein gp37
VPDEWIEEVFKACEKAPQHKYLFLTKNPYKYYKWFPSVGSPQNFWLGATTGDNPKDVTWENSDGSFVTSEAHCISDTMQSFRNSYLSLEPLRYDVSQEIDVGGIDWVIIGQQTGPGAKPPKDIWVQRIINICRESDIPVFVKRPLYERFPIQEWPEGLKEGES